MDSFKAFTAKFPLKTFKKGEVILLKDETPPCVYVIETGLVRTYNISSDGHEQLVSLDRRGEDFPIGYVYGLIDKTQFFYSAHTKCSLRLIPRDKFIEHLNSDVEAMYRRQVRLTLLLLTTISRVHALEQSKASDKIAHTLLYMASQVGVVLRPYKTQLKISITQQEIADSLGLSRETASIELRKLERLRLINHTRKNYVLYVERLKKYLER